MIISHVPGLPSWAWPSFLDCSQECPPLHPGIIHILNLIYSLQHLSHALESYIDMYVHMQLPMWLTGKESACLDR